LVRRNEKVKKEERRMKKNPNAVLFFSSFFVFHNYGNYIVGYVGPNAGHIIM